MRGSRAAHIDSMTDDNIIRKGGAGKDRTQFGEHNRSDAPEGTIKPPRKPGVLGGWEIKNVKTYSIGREGGAFSATIYKDGKRVLLVENTGNGGPNDYTDIATNRRHSGPHIAELTTTAQKAYDDEKMHDPDLFVEFLVFFGQVEKLAAKHGWDRDEVVEENIAHAKKTRYTDVGDNWYDREDLVMRHPELLD